MRKLLLLSVAGLCLVLLASSCKKNLEDEPLEFLSEDNLWESGDSVAYYATGYLTNIYTYLPDGYNRIGGAPLDAATDDAVASNTGSTIYQMANGQYSSASNPDDNWARSYIVIRRANTLLQNIDRVGFRSDIAYLKTYYKGEARFLRALAYFELVKRYGGVPLVGNLPLTLDDNIQIPKSTFAQCVAYIVSDCDSASKQLRADPVATQDFGRATKGTALALKARVLLYAASPLNNPGKDLNHWKQAADAAQALMNTSSFSLDTSFLNLFTRRNSREIIFAKTNAAPTNTIEYANTPVGYTVGGVVSQGQVSPTQQLVDAFPMSNGRAVNETGSGYDASNPYNNRDPRFYLTIFHNNMRWLSRPVETFTEGRDNLSTSTVRTRTGYYARKFMGDNTNATAFANVDHVWTLFRYAEVLLNYAEAQNEFGGPDATVENALKAIRQRAKIAAGADGRYGIKAGMTQAEMRNFIMNERRIEFAFEEHRFWDIRRWKIAETVYTQPLTAMVITRNANGTFSYARTPITFFTPAFIARQYLYPIPYSEIIRNNNLVQNDGWN